MRHLSLFTGAGGSEWTAKLLGWDTLAAVESDPFCRQVLRARIDDGSFPPFEIFDDVRTLSGDAWRGKIDIISAGFPCQPFSVAGKQQGADDDRNMWPETARIIREVRPRLVFLENSINLRCASTGYYLAAALRDLAILGFDAEWEVLSAASLGAPHIRRRLWILAYTHSERVRDQQAEDGRVDSTPIASNAGEARQASADTGGERCPPVSPYSRAHKHSQTSGHGTDGSACDVWGTWPFEPGFCGVVHGLADRFNRVKALGNGWVPIVAATAFRRLLASMKGE